MEEVKKYLKKNGALKGSQLERMMLYLNSQPSSTPGLESPFARFYGRLPKLHYPGLQDGTLCDRRKMAIKRGDQQVKIAQRLKRASTDEFKVGDQVRLRDHQSGLWSILGTIKEKISGEDGVVRTYMIQLDDGGQVIRNASYIRFRNVQHTTEPEEISSKPVCSNDPATPADPEKEPARLGVTTRSKARAA